MLGLNRVVFDGQGNVSGTATANKNGALTQSQIAGTYTVNAPNEAPAFAVAEGILRVPVWRLLPPGSRSHRGTECGRGGPAGRGTGDAIDGGALLALQVERGSRPPGVSSSPWWVAASENIRRPPFAAPAAPC